MTTKQNKYLKELSMLNFMDLSTSVLPLVYPDFKLEWKTPGMNFYVKHYRFVKQGNNFGILWVNKHGDDKFLLLRKPKFKWYFLNKLYFMLRHQLSTDDIDRAENVLEQVIFPDFCREYNLHVTFPEDAQKETSYADSVLCNLYKNFFKGVPLDIFFKMFKINERLSSESISFIRSECS